MNNSSKEQEDKSNVTLDWSYFCGRCFLMVNGYAVIMDGDPHRDPDLLERFQSKFWTEEMIKFIVEGNKV